MPKLLIIFFITVLYCISLHAQDLPSTMDDKPACHMLGPSDLELKNKVKVSYRTYHDYLYSRRIFRPSKTSIKEILLADRFSYPEIDRWITITKWMNKNNPTETGEIYLPPCHIIETGEIAQEPPRVETNPSAQPAFVEPVPQSEVISSSKKGEIKSKNKWKYLSFSAGAVLGSVSVKSDDALNSKFDLLFLKFTFSASYKLAKNISAYAGAGLNNYLSVNFSSDAGKEESNQVNHYWDYFAGLRKKISSHIISLQYDNMNFLLNQNQTNEFRLTPTRVDRISIMDNLKLNEKLALMGAIGIFHPLFSKAQGYDLSLGPVLEFSENWNIYVVGSLNQLEKDDIKNTSQAYVLGTGYKF